MFVDVSWARRRKPRGWKAVTCSRCQRVVAHRVDDLEETMKLYGIELPRAPPKRFLLTCAFCGNSELVTAKRPLVTVPEWSRQLGLGRLVETTAPHLAERVTKGGPTETQLRALVDVAQAHRKLARRRLDKPAGLGFLGGCLVGPLVAIGLYSLGLRPWNLHEYWFAMMGLFAGIVVMPILTVIVYVVSRRWRFFDEHIRAAMERNEIDARSLVEAAGGVDTAVGRRVQRVALPAS